MKPAVVMLVFAVIARGALAGEEYDPILGRNHAAKCTPTHAGR